MYSLIINPNHNYRFLYVSNLIGMIIKRILKINTDEGIIWSQRLLRNNPTKIWPEGSFGHDLWILLGHIRLFIKRGGRLDAKDCAIPASCGAQCQRKGDLHRGVYLGALLYGDHDRFAGLEHATGLHHTQVLRPSEHTHIICIPFPGQNDIFSPNNSFSLLQLLLPFSEASPLIFFLLYFTPESYWTNCIIFCPNLKCMFTNFFI